MSRERIFSVQTATVCVALASTLLLGACSSDSDTTTPLMDDPSSDNRPGLMVTGLNGTPADELVSQWLVSTDIYRTESYTADNNEVFVQLLRYTDNSPVSQHVDFYTPNLDTCEFSDPNDVNDTGDTYSGKEFVSGGSTVTINTGSGPWIVVPAIESETGRYQTTAGTPGPLPADATLSIPGADFPNVPAFSLHEPTVPVRITPVAGPLTAADAASLFTWVAMPGNAGGYITITGRAFGSDGAFVRFPFSCDVLDDGEFEMPQEVIDAIAMSEFSIDVRYERVIRKVELIDGIVFHQRSNVAE